MRGMIQSLVGQSSSAQSQSPVRVFSLSHSQSRRRKNVSITAVTAPMIANIHQNAASSPPGRCGSGTFIPYMPVSTVIGMKIVEMMVSTFITPFSWFETFDRCASSRLEMRSWK